MHHLNFKNQVYQQAKNHKIWRNVKNQWKVVNILAKQSADLPDFEEIGDFH